MISTCKVTSKRPYHNVNACFSQANTDVKVSTPAIAPRGLTAAQALNDLGQDRRNRPATPPSTLTQHTQSQWTQAQ
eukprot:scaffold274183_cov22-Prasinocladus_malaysianus.AAC.1